MTADEDAKTGGSLDHDKRYKTYRDDVAKQYFGGGKNAIRDTCILALAIGMSKDMRIVREDWEDRAPWSDMGRLRGTGLDFNTLFDMMEFENEENKDVRVLMNEYVSGGLRFMHDNDLLDRGSLHELQDTVAQEEA